MQTETVCDRFAQMASLVNRNPTCLLFLVGKWTGKPLLIFNLSLVWNRRTLTGRARKWIWKVFSISVFNSLNFCLWLWIPKRSHSLWMTFTVVNGRWMVRRAFSVSNSFYTFPYRRRSGHFNALSSSTNQLMPEITRTSPIEKSIILLDNPRKEWMQLLSVVDLGNQLFVQLFHFFFSIEWFTWSDDHW
jgi:hypothetical protein